MLDEEKAANDIALEINRKALVARTLAWELLQQQQTLFIRAKRLADETQLAVTLSVSCPATDCRQPVGARCIDPWQNLLGVFAQHSLRQDISGLHGEKSRQRVLQLYRPVT